MVSEAIERTINLASSGQFVFQPFYALHSICWDDSMCQPSLSFEIAHFSPVRANPIRGVWLCFFTKRTESPE